MSRLRDVIRPSSSTFLYAFNSQECSTHLVDHIIPFTTWTRLIARDSSRRTKHRTCRRCPRAGLNTQLQQVLFQKVINTKSKHSDALQVTNTITIPLPKPRHTLVQSLLLSPLLRLNHNLLFPHHRLLSIYRILSRKITIIPLLNTVNLMQLDTIHTHQMPGTTHIHHTASLDSTQSLPLTSHDADHSPKIVPSAKRSFQTASHGSLSTPSSADALSTTPTPTRVFGSSQTML